jgi:hypothetical protein
MNGGRVVEPLLTNASATRWFPLDAWFLSRFSDSTAINSEMTPSLTPSSVNTPGRPRTAELRKPLFRKQTRSRPTNAGQPKGRFADLCLTTWLRRRVLTLC